MNQKGQAILESLLVMAIVMGVWMGVSKILKDQDVFQNIFGRPWERITNIIEFGIPSSRGGTTLGPFHPTSYDRHSSRKPEGA